MTHPNAVYRIERRSQRRPVLACGVLIALFVFGASVATPGCDTDLGAELETALSEISLLPTTDDISQDVRIACDGVMTESEMLAGIVTARLDRSNGYSRSDEEISAFTGCTLDTLFANVTFDACTACKSAILDQVYGE